MRLVRKRTWSDLGLASLLCLTLGLTASHPALAQSDDNSNSNQTVEDEANPLDNGAILLQADEAVFDPETGQYIAQGNVEATYGSRTLLAERVAYDQSTGQVIASGGVTIIEETGVTLSASRVELDGALKDGFVESLGLLLAENTRLAALSAERRGDVTHLNRAVYSPCEVCKEEGKREPLWQIKAMRVTHDKGQQIISYRHAVLEVRGVPIFYTPYFSHADPTVPRKSGFLVPEAGNSSDLGNFVEIPYHWVLAPNYDVTLSPLYLSEEQPVMKAEFRMRTKRGIFKFDGSITNPDERDETGTLTGGREIRNHLFGDGRFDLNKFWRWGFDAALTSDGTYLKRYNISEEDELTNRLFLTGTDGRSHMTVESFYFVGLRQTDAQGLTPLILPNANATYYFDDPVFGGTMSIASNALALLRNDGTDVQRVSITPTWDRRIKTPGGHLLDLKGTLRTDFYHVNDLRLSETAMSAKDEDFTARFLPTVSATWHYPLARNGWGGLQIIEPIAQIALSPIGGNPEEVPNEDSLSFEFDETNLFSPNRFPGLDRFEDGVRFNIGVRAALVDFGAGENSLMFGQSFRARESDIFDPASGLGENASDYVGRIAFSPNSFLRLTHRFRLDKDNFEFQRNEVDLDLGNDDYSLNLGYLRLAEQLTELDLGEREEFDFETDLKIRGNWSFHASGRRNLVENEMVRAQAAFVYEDECTAFEIAVRRRFTRDRDIEPATSIFFRVRLKSLG